MMHVALKPVVQDPDWLPDKSGWFVDGCGVLCQAIKFADGRHHFGELERGYPFGNSYDPMFLRLWNEFCDRL